MSAQHTQGGWNRNIKPASKYNTIYAGRNTHICRLITDGLPESEIEANCNLIAAAPDLLEAAETAIVNIPYSIEPCVGIAIKALRAAINKAKGE